MYTDQDISGVLSFIQSTPEGNLRKMLVGADLTEVHFRLLLKVAKGGSEADFISAFQAETLPKIRLSPAEIKIKEGFWGVCKKKLGSLGLLSLSSTPKAA